MTTFHLSAYLLLSLGKGRGGHQLDQNALNQEGEKVVNNVDCETTAFHARHIESIALNTIAFNTTTTKRSTIQKAAYIKSVFCSLLKSY